MSKQNHRNRKKKSGVGRAIALVVLIVAIGVFIYAGYNLYTLWSQYHAGTVEYNEVIEAVISEDVPEPEEAQEESHRDAFTPVIDWDKLLKINPDVCGWLRFPEPEIINYPVCYCSDNDYYLHHTVEKTYLFSGCLFVDMNNDRNVTDVNTVIYGHAMNNGSMFGDLDKFNDADFFIRNQYFYFQTPDGGVYKYRIIAFYETTELSDSYTLAFEDRFEYAEYQRSMASHSYHPCQTELNPDMPMLTLSTCTNRTETGRYILQGLLVETLEEGTTPRAPIVWE